MLVIYFIYFYRFSTSSPFLLQFGLLYNLVNLIISVANIFANFSHPQEVSLKQLFFNNCW